MRLVAEGLSARRGEDLVFDGLSFTLSAGEALVVTGPNGVGKSTLLRVLAGLLPAAAGHVRVDGAPGEERTRVAEFAHYLGHRNAMKRELTVAENLDFWRRFTDDGRGRPALSIAEAASAVGLGAIAHLPFGYLSAGQQRRMAMAKLLVSHRPIWLLDEPTAALDAASDAMFAGLVAAHCEAGGIVVAATHQPLGLTAPKTLAMAPRAPERTDEAFA